MYPIRKHDARFFVSDFASSISSPHGNNRRMTNRIKEFREEAGLSLEALANRIGKGATRSTIQKLESGAMNLTQVWMERIAQALHKSPIDLLPYSKPSNYLVDEVLFMQIVDCIKILESTHGLVVDANILLKTAGVYNIFIQAKNAGESAEVTPFNVSLILGKRVNN